ncbi:MAG: hypothetical protein B7Z58_11955 [Acidiphilium sp. 37-64-53]|nr:MAG: hypothetical protein B7Z58_11955 [Acidiphilium sp. 37-64-53]
MRSQQDPESPGHAQRFLSAHDQIANLFRPELHRLTARSFRQARADALSLGAVSFPERARRAAGGVGDGPGA